MELPFRFYLWYGMGYVKAGNLKSGVLVVCSTGQGYEELPLTCTISWSAIQEGLAHAHNLSFSLFHPRADPNGFKGASFESSSIHR